MKQGMQKELIVQRLRDRGLRITKQRLLLIDVILEGNCSSCKEIFYEASRQDQTIGTATVYRMINALEEIGAISRKNMYKMACCEECSFDYACTIELDDNTVIELPENHFSQILKKGLEECGYLKGRKIRSVIAPGCVIK
ncbi:MAG: transcriptional repressor [Acetatifactor sp.]|nr:transcriptional repressor [Acetatifactor sp.]